MFNLKRLWLIDGADAVLLYIAPPVLLAELDEKFTLVIAGEEALLYIPPPLVALLDKNEILFNTGELPLLYIPPPKLCSVLPSAFPE